MCQGQQGALLFPQDEKQSPLVGSGSKGASMYWEHALQCSDVKKVMLVMAKVQAPY